jgi:predicted amidohydrolase
LVRLAEQAAQGSDLVVLPEMAVTGYTFPDAEAVRAVAELPDGPTFQALRPVARRGGCWVVAGFAERAGPRLFNSALVIDPTGALHGVYRKTLLYEADLPWATSGDSGYLCFEVAGRRVGTAICMDLNDDRLIDWLRAERVEVLAFPTNWVEEGVDTWPYWAWRLDDTGVALVAANTWGSEGAVRFSGRSAILWDRTIHAAAPATGDGVVRAELALPQPP